MALQEWELHAHQPAAVEMCHRLNVSPFTPLNPGGPQQWVEYAVRMAEHELMIQIMRQYGRLV